MLLHFSAFCISTVKLDFVRLTSQIIRKMAAVLVEGKNQLTAAERGQSELLGHVIPNKDERASKAQSGMQQIAAEVLSVRRFLSGN
jgi:hypothetical protein